MGIVVYAYFAIVFSLLTICRGCIPMPTDILWEEI